MMKIRLLIILFLTALISSCSLIEDQVGSCPADDGRDDNVMLSFQLDAAGSLIGSRTDDKNHPEVGSEWIDFEDGIDFNDLGIFVFAKKWGETDDTKEKLVFSTTDVLNDEHLHVEGAIGAYTIEMNLKKRELENVVDVNDSENPNIGIRILILANGTSAGTSGQAKWGQLNGLTTYKEIIDKLDEWNYSMGYIYNTNSTTDKLNDIFSKKYIPMFGTDIFRVSQQELYDSREDRRVYLGQIDLLRSLAKVRVVDNITPKNAAGYPKIIGVTFMGSQSMSHQLPFDAFNYINGTQVHTPKISAPDSKDFNKDGGEFRLGLLPDVMIEPGIVVPDNQNFEQSVRIGFVPEQAIYPISHSDNASEIIGCPMFRIRIAQFKGDDDNDVVMDYNVAMSRFPDFGDNILRNHIYTLSVLGVTTASLDLKVVVDPWDVEHHEIDFTNNVAMAEDGALVLTNYASYNESEGRVVLPNYPQTVTGEFGISQPVGCRWDAYLVTTAGELGAIKFAVTGSDGKVTYTDHISGKIDGQKATFRVAATQSAGTEMRTAMLQVMVTMADGLTVPVNILKTTGSGPENITFIQNRK